jgi:interferon gamma-inducible protein 30
LFGNDLFFQVIEQCKSHVWKTGAASDRVNLSIYYETLCPDCRQFITTQVWNAYQSILDIVNITFVPYGNARELYRPETKLYQFYCQHGAEECYGNVIHVILEKRNNIKILSLFLFL